jgi:uncharacterized protein YciI
MATFIFILQDKNQVALTRQIYYSHVEYLSKQKKEARLFMAGPLKGQDKILQIYHTDTFAAAEEIVKNDPYVRDGFYRTYEGYEWIEANEDNNWLMNTPSIQEMLKNLS